MIENIITNLGPAKALFLSLLIIFGIVGLIITSFKSGKRLNSIKAKEVGDGQHGTDKVLEESDMRELYEVVKIPKKLVDMSHEWKPGRILHFNPKTSEAIVDTSSTHAAVEAPTEVGKTSTYVVPNAQYNMMAGTTMIIPCVKPELIDLLKSDAEALGYKTGIIDFGDPSNSLGFDFFSDINEKIESYRKTNNYMDLAEAETLAGRIAEDITTSKESNDKENKFFKESSIGLVHSVILLVTLFAEKSEKHLSSVRALIQGILMLKADADGEDKVKRSKVQKLIGDLPDNFGPKKHVGAAFAATHETEDNIYSSVLGDLRAINNTMAEQVVSVPGCKEHFNFKDLIDHKYILFINMPETMPEFYVFSKLIIKKICTQLANYANKYYGGELPKIIKVIWDEFGLSPKIDNFHQEMAIDRGKGILFDLIYQDPAQLKLSYGEDAMKVILRQCATEIILGIAPTNGERAKELAEVIGKKTIMTGSVSRSTNTGIGGTGGSNSITHQMTERELLTVGEILRMEQDQKRLVFRRGQYPFLAYFPSYYKEEWGITPRKRDKVIPSTLYYEPKYFQLTDLQEELEKLKPDSGISSIDVSFDHELYEGMSPLEQIVEQITQITNHDQNAIQLLVQEKYMDFMKYMNKYKSKVSRFELQAMLEHLTDD